MRGNHTHTPAAERERVLFLTRAAFSNSKAPPPAAAAPAGPTATFGITAVLVRSFQVVERLAPRQSTLHSHHGDQMDQSPGEHALSPLAADASGATETRTLTAIAIASGSASDAASAAIGAASDGIDAVQTLANEPTTLVAATMAATAAAAAAAAAACGPPFDSVGADADSTSNLYAIIWNREYDLLVPLALSWNPLSLIIA